jgi:predicted Rdx family selenoprotein
MRTLLVLASMAGALTLAACGSAGDGQPATVTVVRKSAPAQPTPAKPKQNKKRAKKPHAPAAPTYRACDANITVKSATTTCPFAQNVFYGYWLNQAEPGVFADSPGVPAYSPAAGRTFNVDCSGTSTIVCRAGDGGYVRFSVAAVSAYTMAQAKRYAAAAELGDVPAPDDTSEQTVPAPSPGGDGGDCDPSYEGACLDPNSSDYDCEGGSGDGPDYTGPVTVVGDDHFGLDRNDDGSACE